MLIHYHCDDHESKICKGKDTERVPRGRCFVFQFEDSSYDVVVVKRMQLETNASCGGGNERVFIYNKQVNHARGLRKLVIKLKAEGGCRLYLKNPCIYSECDFLLPEFFRIFLCHIIYIIRCTHTNYTCS